MPWLRETPDIVAIERKRKRDMMLRVSLLLIGILLILVVVDSGFLDQVAEEMEQEYEPIGASNGVYPKEKEKPPVIYIPTLESQVHALVNEQRIANGLAPLKWNQEIADSARKHSQYLANRSFIRHEGEDGKLQDSRLNEDGIYYFDLSGENLAQISIVKECYAWEGSSECYSYVYNSQSELAWLAVEGWMNSAGHRANILTSGYNEAGVGIATDSTGKWYVFTQVFVRKVDCGYKDAVCCDEPYPYLDSCYLPYYCINGVCK